MNTKKKKKKFKREIHKKELRFLIVTTLLKSRTSSSIFLSVLRM